MWEKIDLNHRARQKFLWFLFPSPADSCCSGKPARAAQEQLFMKQNEQALIPAATATQLLWSCQGTFLCPNVKAKINQPICEVPQKVSGLSEVFWKRNEGGAEHGGDCRVSWWVAGIPSQMTDGRAAQPWECPWHQPRPHNITGCFQVGRDLSRPTNPSTLLKVCFRADLLQVWDYSENSLHAEIPRDTSSCSLL